MKWVGDALGDVDRWAAGQHQEVQSDLAEVDAQLEKVRVALANLDRQREALEAGRESLEVRVAGLSGDRLQRAHQAMFAVLAEHARHIGEREALVAPLVHARLGGLDAELRGSAMAPLLEEYDQFVSTMKPNLESLPESYRTAVVQHHERITDRLAEHLRSVAATPEPVQADALQVEIVYAVDAPEGEEELLVVVVPVSDELVLQWHQHADGLQTWLAARSVQAIYEAARVVSFTAVQATCGGHQGLMAIEVELYEAPTGYVAVFEERLTELLSTSEELAAARIGVTPRRVDVDIVLPPEAGAPRAATSEGAAPAGVEGAHAG